MQQFKKKLKRSVSFLLAMTLVLSSAFPGQAKASKVAKIQCTKPYSDGDKVVKTTLMMKKGKTYKIKTKYAGKKLVYKSSRKKVASVSKMGKIKAKRVGKTRITVSPKGNKKVKAVITVTVVKSLKKVKKIKLNSKQLSLTAGQTGQLKASIVSPKKPTTKKLNWFSSNKKIAVVNKKGVVTAKAAGTAQITVTAADGQGAKAVCRVTVTAGSTDVQSTKPGVSTAKPSPTPTNGTGNPNISDTPNTSDKPDTEVTVSLSVPGDRAGIKQGETMQLSAKDAETGKEVTNVQWSVSEVAGVSISDSGSLVIAKDVPAGEKIKVTVKNAVSSDAKELTIIENKVPEITENMVQINKSTEAAPFGLTYRTGSKGEKAFTTVSDPERGDVLKFDASVGYTSNSYDVLAWMDVDSLYAGKTVTISGYMKYDKVPDKETMNLVINERWKYSNPAVKWEAQPDTWYYITGTYTFPEYDELDYDGNRNRLYICRDVNMPKGVNTVYYLDDITFTVEKAQIEGVEISTAEDADEIYQNHTLQCSAVVNGEGKFSQQVTYSIDPPVTGATISEDGLLTVKNVKAGSEITIKAASKEDPSKFDTKTVKVLAQTINSVTVSAENNPTVIYQNNSLAFSADVASTGEPDDTVTWSVSPTVAGASISEEGVLSVGDVAAGTVLHVKATSVFDKEKSDTYDITVAANKVNGVTIKSAGDKTTISPGEQMSLSAQLDVTGTPSKDVTWSLKSQIQGVSLASSKGSTNKLIVEESVSEGTEITVRAVSDFDTSKFGEITVVVESASQTVFDINKLKIEGWYDFDDATSTTMNDKITEAGVSYQTTVTDTVLTETNVKSKYAAAEGVQVFGKPSATGRTKAMKYWFGAKDDYIQFEIKNTSNQDKMYQLSFMFLFSTIANEKKTDVRPDYNLPLQLVSIDDTNKETVLKDDINIPYRCYLTNGVFSRAYQEISGIVNIPAGKTVWVRLKMKGELPTECLAGKTEHEGVVHPIECRVDNISISSGAVTTLSLKKGETYQLQLDTLEGDTVSYYTNSYLAKYTHDNDTDSRVQEECAFPHWFNTPVAEVNESGLITASNAGDTALIAVITHADGSVERRQCLVHVEA